MRDFIGPKGLSASLFPAQSGGFLLRRPFLFGLVFSLSFFGSFQANAADWRLEARWRALSEDGRAVVDRLAADFYEEELRLSQSRNIEATTAEIYAGLTDKEKAAFREERRTAWQAMTEEQQRALRNTELPAYANLTEEQKAPFRQIALDRIAPAPLNAADEETVETAPGEADI